MPEITRREALTLVAGAAISGAMAMAADSPEEIMTAAHVDGVKMLPDEMRRNFEANATLLSPIEIHWKGTRTSPLNGSDFEKAVKEPDYCKYEHFSEHFYTYRWQAGMAYESHDYTGAATVPQPARSATPWTPCRRPSPARRPRTRR